MTRKEYFILLVFIFWVANLPSQIYGNLSPEFYELKEESKLPIEQAYLTIAPSKLKDKINVFLINRTDF